MKIQKIQSLCKSAKRITVIKDDERYIQWLGEGSCFYPLFKLPRLSAENIFAIFDIPEEKQGKIFFEERDELPRAVDFSDVSDGETIITPEGGGVIFEGRTLVIFKSSLGVITVDKKYLAPFDDEVTYYERKTASGQPYIVAKEGMFISGIVMPYNGGNKLGEWLSDIGEGIVIMADNLEHNTQE
ncbi:MAG: hypothetical protein IJE25_08255 [Clostridia bacterium]|nr:hypothetical protein [Clostridia bacterium]